MQLSGSFSQSELQPKRSHDNQPIGGVRASPLSKDRTTPISASPTNTNEEHQLRDSKAIVFFLFGPNFKVNDYSSIEVLVFVAFEERTQRIRQALLCLRCLHTIQRYFTYCFRR